jgi:Fe2+ transport system protein FeoA
LQQHNLMPGTKLLIKGGTPFNDALTATNSEGREVTIGSKTAQRIWVVPA